jgi:hypothetical protein
LLFYLFVLLVNLPGLVFAHFVGFAASSGWNPAPDLHPAARWIVAWAFNTAVGGVALWFVKPRSPSAGPPIAAP